MLVTIGTRLGSHEITALLGEGGMGQVYRARDTKLKRDVAIKILPEEFSNAPDLLARLQREAEVLASLNHPNIAAIYDFQEAAGSLYLVLELVEGETLADGVRRGPAAIEDVLNVAMQICEALEAAHSKGIIHRDLKPANVKVTAEGKVKVLDFGLAKAMESSSVPRGQGLSNSPTLSLAATNAGIIIGTAAYMSPEQARGQTVDARSDMFSLGCVLYEMLTGQQAFQGETVSDILAAVLAREPDLDKLPANANPRLKELLLRCFDKNPKRRWHAAGDLRIEIESILADPRGLRISGPGEHRRKPLWQRAIPVLGATVLAAALTGAGMLYFAPTEPRTVMRFSMRLAEDQRFTSPNRRLLAISPNGNEMVYVANGRLYRRSLQNLEAAPIPGTNLSTQITDPVFSPDGRSLVVYLGDGTLKKINVSGGAALTICAADPPYLMSWDASGILFGQSGKGILRVSENGGEPKLVVRVRDDELAQGPQMLPNGEAILITVAAGASMSDWDSGQIAVQSLKSGERKVLIKGGSDARYVPTGHIIYALAGTLFAVPFDSRRLEVTGGPFPVLEGVRRSVVTGVAQYAISDTG